jgi:O-antigen ligase
LCGVFLERTFMGLRFFIFGSLFGVALIGAFFNPLLGILAYFGHYYLWPEHQWWGEFLAQAGVRVSLLISIIIAVSIVLHWQKLKEQIAGSMVHSQELILVAYVAIIGLSELWGRPSDGTMEDIASELFIKMVKVGLFIFMMTHVLTTPGNLIQMLRFATLVGGGYLAWEAYTAPDSAYENGRLEGIGGPDFQDSNFMAAHFVVMGILAGLFVILERRLVLKVAYLFIGALIANAVVLTRSRGAFLAIAVAGVTAFLVADARVRKYVLALLPLVALGGYRLMDQEFRERMTTIVADAGDRDESAESRLELWRASWEIFRDHPLGIGVGNFYSTIGSYRFQLAGRDTHSTFLRCLTELGILGATALLALFCNAIRVLRRCQHLARSMEGNEDLANVAIGLQVAVVAFAVSGLTITMTYCEEFFIFLLLPVCCHRAVLNARLDSVDDFVHEPLQLLEQVT